MIAELADKFKSFYMTLGFLLRYNIPPLFSEPAK
jgi:hypothetical protein